MEVKTRRSSLELRILSVFRTLVKSEETSSIMKYMSKRKLHLLNKNKNPAVDTHVSNNVSVVDMTCKKCKYKGIDSDDLKHHRSSCSKEKIYICFICQHTFKSEEKLNLHINKYNHRQYNCHKCQGIFTTLRSLENHMQTHKGARPYPCDVCTSRFRQMYHLKAHVKRVHTDNKPNKCHKCRSSFNSVHQLRSHVENNHMEGKVSDYTVEKPFQCEICISRFRESGLLKAHIKRVHTAEKLHTCSKCQSSFNSKHMLEDHIDNNHLDEEADSDCVIIS